VRLLSAIFQLRWRVYEAGRPSGPVESATLRDERGVRTCAGRQACARLLFLASCELPLLRSGAHAPRNACLPLGDEFWRAPVLSVSLAARGCCAYFGCRRHLCSAPHLHAASAGCPARAARVRVIAGCAEQLNPAERSGAVRRSTHRLPCT